MSYTPVQKAAKPVWAKQLTRLPCHVVCVKFKFVYTTKSKNGQSAFAGFPQFPRPTLRGIGEALGVSNVFTSAS